MFLQATAGEWLTCRASLSVEAGWRLPNGQLVGYDGLSAILHDVVGIEVRTEAPPAVAGDAGGDALAGEIEVRLDEVVLHTRDERGRPLTGFYDCQ